MGAPEVLRELCEARLNLQVVQEVADRRLQHAGAVGNICSNDREQVTPRHPTEATKCRARNAN